MLYSLLIIVDVLIALAMTVFILLQQGKGATAGAAFGAGASSTVFGSRGSASFLSRMTAVLAVLFFLNSLGLAFIAKNQTGPQSIVEKLGDQVQQQEQVIQPEDLPEEVAPASDVPEDLPQ